MCVCFVIIIINDKVNSSIMFIYSSRERCTFVVKIKLFSDVSKCLLDFHQEREPCTFREKFLQRILKIYYLCTLFCSELVLCSYSLAPADLFMHFSVLKSVQ